MSCAKPWEGEPDEFTMEAYGLPIRGKRGPLGAWCGYVGVPLSHSLYGQDYSDNVPCPPKALEHPTSMDQHGIVNILLAAAKIDEWGKGYAPMTLLFQVHGGLTFAGPIKEGGDFWYLGFDCGHFGDLTPYMAERYSELMDGHIYRTIDYVRGECLHLAEQLAAYGSCNDSTSA